MNIPTTNNNSFPLNKIKNSLTYGSFGVVILILVIIVFILLYNKSAIPKPNNISKSTKIIETCFIVIAIMLAILTILFLTIPNYRDILSFLSKLKYVLLLIFYIIGLIVSYRNLTDYMYNYLFIIGPLSLILGVFLFYFAFQSSQGNYDIDINIDRIKYILIYFCLIVFLLLFYTLDPGGYIKTYFGQSLIITILLVVFGFLYLLTIMTLPTSDSNANGKSFFKGITRLGIFSSVLFIVFLITVVYGIVFYPGGFLNGAKVIGSDKANQVSTIIILLIVIFVLWILFFGILSSDGVRSLNLNNNFETITTYAKSAFLMLFGLICSSLLIAWIVIGAQSLTSQTGIVSFILNLLVIFAILILVFKLITGTSYYKKSPIYRLVINIVLYIPCLFVSLIDWVGSLLGISAPLGKSTIEVVTNLKTSFTNNLSNSMKNTPYTYYIVLLFVIFIYLLYYLIVPTITIKNATQGGVQLINNPIFLNSEKIIGNYDEINGTTTEQYGYNYGISFWTFIDATAPSARSSLEKYTSILNFGGKPNILYNASQNTLMITMLSTDRNTIGNNSSLKKQKLDSNGNIIIYKLRNVLLQKWNHIVINYNGGTLDIFYNGKLVKSVNEVVPQMSKDTLVVGENKGINGGICNVNYFNKDLNIKQIYYLYNSVKDKTPPVVKINNETVIQNIPKAQNIIYPENNIIDIPININTQALPKSIDLVDTPDTSNIEVEYLSQKWYSMNNNDNITGL